MNHIIHVQRGKTLQYALDGSGWTAIAKNTYTDLRQGYVQLFYDEVEQLTAKQNNVCLHLISIPLRVVGLGIHNPYLIYSKGKPLGEIRYKARCSTMKIYGQTYEYRIHSQYVSSLAMGEQQIAVLKFHYRPYYYAVTCNEIGENHLGALLLLCAYYDARDYANEIHFGVSYLPNDRFADRASWKPE